MQDTLDDLYGQLAGHTADSSSSSSSGSPGANGSGSGGTGLANLRERLRSLHGQDARLQLIENQLGGVTARLRLPILSLNTVTPSTPSAP